MCLEPCFYYTRSDLVSLLYCTWHIYRADQDLLKPDMGWRMQTIPGGGVYGKTFCSLACSVRNIVELLQKRKEK